MSSGTWPMSPPSAGHRTRTAVAAAIATPIVKRCGRSAARHPAGGCRRPRSIACRTASTTRSTAVRGSQLLPTPPTRATSAAATAICSNRSGLICRSGATRVARREGGVGGVKERTIRGVTIQVRLKPDATEMEQVRLKPDATETTTAVGGVLPCETPGRSQGEIPYNSMTCSQPTSGIRTTTTGSSTASGPVRRTRTFRSTSG